MALQLYGFAQMNSKKVEQSLYGSRPPGYVVIFVPGTMQALFDQSIGLFTRQITAACNRFTGTADYVPGYIEEIRLPSGRTFQQAKITHQIKQSELSQSVVVVAANYTEMLSEKLTQSSILMRFARLSGFLLRVTPLLYRVLNMAPRCGQANLSPAHKRFLIGVFAFVILAVIVATVTVMQALGGSPKFLVILSVLIALLIPPRTDAAMLATRNEYYGLIRYLLNADKRREIQRYLEDVHTSVRSLYPSASLHVVCFSFGCVVEFDYLFAADLELSPKVELGSLTFIGFPYTVIDVGKPRYFGNGRWPGGKIGQWKNLYLADDVLGSRITGHLCEMFNSPNEGIPLGDKEVTAQRERRSWANPDIRHLAYWDPKANEPCEAIQNVARTILENPPVSPKNQFADALSSGSHPVGRRSGGAQ
jgi:hypothetical protein